MKEGQFSVPRLAMPCITIHSSGGQFIDLQILMSSKPSMIHYDSHMCRSFVPFRSESQDVPESMRRREKRAFWQNLRKLLRFLGKTKTGHFQRLGASLKDLVSFWMLSHRVGLMAYGWGKWLGANDGRV